MAEQENVQVVQAAFAAFGSGDIPGLLKMLTPDISWRAAGPPQILPWAGSFQGPEQVGKFFTGLDSAVTFQKFEPQEFIAQGDRVVVLGQSEEKLKANGQVVKPNWVMVFKLRNGKIADYQYLDDTAAWVAAIRGE
jgi:ketosteroid isomerase-like protein